jgi:hypothetical protein
VVNAVPPAAPAGCLVSTSCETGPKLTCAVAVALVAVQERHTAVTVYWCLPTDTPVSVQLVALEGDDELGQAALGAPPSRLTK